MKFAVNWYSVDFHVFPENPPPLPGAQLEKRLFGLPPFEFRSI